MGDRHRAIAKIDYGAADLVFGYPQRGDRTVDLVGVRAVAHRVGAQMLGASAIVAATSGAQYTAAPSNAEAPEYGQSGCASRRYD